MTGSWAIRLFCGAVVLAVLAPQEATCITRFKLEDTQLYTFQNVADRGFLTNTLNTNYVVSAGWMDAPTQKWKVSKAVFSTTYILKPVADGLDSKFGMHSVRTRGDMAGVEMTPYTFGLTNDMYWAIIPAEGSFYMLQNVDTDLCLTSNGLGQFLYLARCKMLQSQLWAVHKRP